MKKVLFTATVDSHILQFHLPFLKLFKDKGYEVHVATNGNEEIPYCDKKHVICFERSPIKLNNLKAIKDLRKIINEEKFDIIHCHTPMGSVVTRLAAKKARKKYHTRVIYTAHGFHFYKGAPLKNWLIFYPVEKYLAKYTDTLITINKEDYELAKKKFSKRCKNIEYVPGVGIDEEKFNFTMTKKEKLELRKSLGLKDSDFVLTCVARLDKNKNQGFLIEVMEQLVKEHKNIHLLLVGPDELNGKYQQMVKDKHLENNVHFLGYRNDIPQLLKITNVSVSASLREGLPVNIMEAVISNIPVIAIDTRGVRDLIEIDKNGYIVKKNDYSMFIKYILDICLRKKMEKVNNKNNMISTNINLCAIMEKMKYIYFNKLFFINRNIIYYIKKLKKDIQLRINKVGRNKRYHKLKNKDFTIISNNCFGGITYEYLNLPYNSPTIGLYFFAPEYIKFINRLDYYVSQELLLLDAKDSIYYDQLKKNKQQYAILGKLGDVEIVFLHYNSFNEAKSKWEKRCKRINYANLLFKFNDQNMCTQKELDDFNKLKADNKICFTSKKYNYKGFVVMDKYKNRECVKEDAFYYHKYLDIVSYVNNMKK